MSKLNPIKYIESMLSHHPKSFYLWITDGIVINGKRYIIKEFRLRDGKLYAVIAENKYNPKYFEVQLCPDEETLKAIYKAIEDNKIAINKEITDRTNEITRVDAAIKANTTKINQEITDRTNEINRVDTAVKENTAKINKEIADRTSEIARVDEAINSNTTKINQEITDRTSEISRVDSAINKEITDRTGEISRVDSAIKANTTKIEQETTDRQNEITRVDNVVKSNTAKIDKEITDRTNEITRLDKALKDNKGSIDQDIARIDNAINENTTKINQEITNRQNEINRVDEAINSNTTKINQEITDRNSEITRVNSAIESNTTKINKEITDRTSEVALLDKTIKDNKAAADQTTEGLNTRIESLETYKEGEQTRANQYFESAKAETTRQLTAERTANADTYVTKATHTSDVNDIRNDLATTNATVETAISKADTAQATANTNAQTINALNSSLAQKQDKLTAGEGITIEGNVISSTDGSGSTPQHDTQKEQVLESPRNTITIGHGANGTSETTKVDTNPEKVLEHDNLLTYYGISKTKSGNNTTLGIEYTRMAHNDTFDLNDLLDGRVRSNKFLNAPRPDTWFFVSSFSESWWYVIQEATTLVDDKNTTYRRTKQNNVWGPWREQVGDKSVIDSAISANTTKINQEITDRKSEITRVEGKIPTEIGTVNLFKGSRDFSGSDWIGGAGVYVEDYKGVKIFKNQDLWGGRSHYFEVKAGEEYVFSAYVKSSAKTDVVNFYLPHDSKQPKASGLVSFGSNNEQDSVNIGLTDKYKRIAVKIKITKDGWMAPRIERYNSDAYLFFGGYKLERGNVATDWSPAPEDYDSKLATALEHSNLLTDYGVSKTTTGNTTKLGLEYTAVPNGFDLNTLENGRIRAGSFTNAPHDGTWYFVSSFVEGEFAIQEAVALLDRSNITYRRLKYAGTWGPWREQVGDKSVIDDLITAKASELNDKITSVDNKVCKTVNIDTTNYSGHYSISNGVVTQYKVVAKDGKYIDLENFTFSNGTDPLASARLDSRLLKVLFEYVDTQNKTLLTTSNALFTIDDQHKFVINKTQVTSALCAKNLSTVKSISLL